MTFVPLEKKQSRNKQVPLNNMVPLWDVQFFVSNLRHAKKAEKHEKSGKQVKFRKIVAINRDIIGNINKSIPSVFHQLSHELHGNDVVNDEIR